jgi:H+-transporting ATPase
MKIKDQTNPDETKTVSAVLSEFNVNADTGLSDTEIKIRQDKFGLNEVPEEKQAMVLVFLKHFTGLTAIMLEITIAVSFVLRKFADVYLISGLMLFNAIISFVQERKAAKTVQALKKDLRVSVRVLRESKWLQIIASQLVPGDIIRIRTGDFITADAKLISGNVAVDQSSLTGESKLISKNLGGLLYAGSIIKNGECTAVVVATGLKTFFGKTSQLIQKAKPRLHMDEVVSGVVKILFTIVLTFLSITVAISILRGETFLSIMPLALILLVSAVPVALPAMFTVSMAKGSQFLASKGILVSRLSATEDAATLTTLCIDKTGTLTQNKLSVQNIIPSAKFTVNNVVEYAVMASITANNDPVDMAFVQKAADDKIAITGYHQSSFIPFTAALKRTEATVEKDGKQFKVMKGAYNTIKALCKQPPAEFDSTVQNWGLKGFKTLAVAISDHNVTTMAGIVALIDPPLADSALMVSKIKELGIKIKMLTGDALPIAREIALQVGIGSNIGEASIFRDAASKNGIKNIISYDGFAEVLPQDKYNIVKTLQDHHEITGMTGDGVNDAPALKQAEVGIAVKSASDVAKQASGVILLHEGLENIISLVIVGRTIHHRIANWVVSKVSKTLFTVLFVCIAYIVTGRFIVSAFDMILLLFIIDFVSLTLSTDKVSWSKKPESWAIAPLVKKGFSLGILNIAEAFLWLFIGEKYFSITADSQLHSFGFAILFFTGIFNILIIRTPERFYKQPISKVLLYALVADVIFVIIILAVGLPGLSSLPIWAIGSSLFYFVFCASVINDWLKQKLHF